MLREVQSLVDKYLAWLRSETELCKVDDYIEVSTPYLDRHNDYLQLYVKPENDGFLLTDCGYTIQDLELSEINIDTPRRKALLEEILNGFGITINDQTNALESQSSIEEFAVHKHNLIQAILAVGDLAFSARLRSHTRFHQRVFDWLDKHQIPYTPDVRLSGKSGFDHRFDFLIGEAGSNTERVFRTINVPNRDSIQKLTFAWIDTRANQVHEQEANAILNDSIKPVKESTIQAMKNYKINPYLWSRRENTRLGLGL